MGRAEVKMRESNGRAVSLKECCISETSGSKGIEFRRGVSWNGVDGSKDMAATSGSHQRALSPLSSGGKMKLVKSVTVSW